MVAVGDNGWRRDNGRRQWLANRRLSLLPPPHVVLLCAASSHRVSARLHLRLRSSLRESSRVAGLFFAAADFFTREDEYGMDLGFIMGCRLDGLRLGLGLRLDGFRLDGLQVAWVLQVKRTDFFMGLDCRLLHKRLQYSRSVIYHERGLWAIKEKNGGVFPKHEPKKKVEEVEEKKVKWYPADDVKVPLKNKWKKRPTKLS
ncbi:hypothetical protein Droror1_Dr00016792, partial [Drosera rotundifolia]